MVHKVTTRLQGVTRANSFHSQTIQHTRSDLFILVSIYSAEEAIRQKVDNSEILKCVRKNKYVPI